jgi:phosphotransferase system HPr (HPr) family protein
MDGNNVNLEQLKSTWEKIKWKKCPLTPQEESAFREKIKPMIKCDLSAGELEAIRGHKYFMGTKLWREATNEEAIVDYSIYYMDHTGEQKKELQQLKHTWEKIKWHHCVLTEEEEKEFRKQIVPMKKSDLSPAEFTAILDHRYYMGKDLCREVEEEEAIIDFALNYWETWQKEKNEQDNQEQIVQIQKLARDIAKKAGCQPNEEPTEEAVKNALPKAIDEWHQVHAKSWREFWESMDHNDIKRISIAVENTAGLHMRPAGDLVKIAIKYKCVIYIHKPGMNHYSIKVKGKPYLNVQTVLAVLPLMSLAISKGDVIEFIAYGEQAEEALKAIEQLVRQHLG